MQNHHLRTRKIWFVSIPWTLLNHAVFSSFLWVDTVDTSRFEADLGSTSQGYFAHGSLVVWHGVNFQVPSMWICQLSVVMSPGFIGFIVWTFLNNIGCSAQFAWCMLVSCPFLASLLGVRNSSIKRSGQRSRGCLPHGYLEGFNLTWLCW